MGQALLGCLGYLLIFVFLPFVGGIIAAFAIGGWLFGISAIIYTIAAFAVCSKVESKKAGGIYFLLMIPLYALEIYGFYNGFYKNN